MPEKFEGDVPPQEDAENLSTPEQVVSLMESSKSEEEWNANCDKVKAAHNNDYPNWWYKEIVMSGILSKTQAKWEK